MVKNAKRICVAICFGSSNNLTGYRSLVDANRLIVRKLIDLISWQVNSLAKTPCTSRARLMQNKNANETCFQFNLQGNTKG